MVVIKPSDIPTGEPVTATAEYSTLKYVRTAAENVGVRIKRETRIVPTLSFDILKSDLQILAKLPEVKEIWYDFKTYTQLDSAGAKFGIPGIRQKYNVTGKGQTVYVLDVAMDLDHPALKNNVVGNLDLVKDPKWIDPEIEHHASHVGGSIASNNSKYPGIAPDAKLFSVKILNSEGAGEMSTIIEGIDQVIDHGGKLINLSVGGLNPTCIGTCPVCKAIDKAAEQYNIISVIAAGNSGFWPYTICCPGKSSAALTIGAIDDDKNLAWFSSRSGLGSVDKPDLCAPGVDIISCSGNGKFMNMSGTSMATPWTSGNVCLILELSKSGLDPAVIKDILKDTADGGMMYNTGAGAINIDKALQFIQSSIR